MAKTYEIVDNSPVGDKEKLIEVTEPITRFKQTKFTLQEKINDIARHRARIVDLKAEIKHIETTQSLDTKTDIDSL